MIIEQSSCQGPKRDRMLLRQSSPRRFLGPERVLGVEQEIPEPDWLGMMEGSIYYSN